MNIPGVVLKPKGKTVKTKYFLTPFTIDVLRKYLHDDNLLLSRICMQNFLGWRTFQTQSSPEIWYNLELNVYLFIWDQELTFSFRYNWYLQIKGELVSMTHPDSIREAILSETKFWFCNADLLFEKLADKGISIRGNLYPFFYSINDFGIGIYFDPIFRFWFYTALNIVFRNIWSNSRINTNIILIFTGFLWLHYWFLAVVQSFFQCPCLPQMKQMSSGFSCLLW